MSLASHLWESTLCAGLAALLAMALKHAPARVRHEVWLCASLKFLVPFPAAIALGSSLAAWMLPTGMPTVAVAIRWLDDSLSQWPLDSATAADPAAFLPRVPDAILHALIAVWAGGVVTLIVWRCRQWRSLSRSPRIARPLEDRRVATALARAPAPPGGRRRLAVLVCGSTGQPAVIGIRHPTLLWPQGLTERLTDRQIDAILAHELCHIARGDNLRALIHVVVECVFWFHPIVWWIGARLVSERERACDEEVLNMGADKRNYAEAILTVCGHSLRAPAAFAATVGGSDLSRRIGRIMATYTPPSISAAARLVLGSILAAAVAIPLGIGVLNAQRAPSRPAASVAADTTPGQQDHSDVHRPGQDVTWPKLVHDVKPAYTREAMDAGIQGVVLLEAIVLEDGSVGRVDVVRSLDAVYGLDDEAVTALKKWRFEPGLKDGKPVAVLVPVEMSFTLK